MIGSLFVGLIILIDLSWAITIILMLYGAIYGTIRDEIDGKRGKIQCKENHKIIK